MTDHLTTLREMRERALAGGGPERVADQKRRARAPPGSGSPSSSTRARSRRSAPSPPTTAPTSAWRTSASPGTGRVRVREDHGRRVAVFAHDFTVLAAPSPPCSRRRSAGCRTSPSRAGSPHRPQRLGRGPHPGGRAQPRRVRGGLHAQRPRLRGHPQISVVLGALRGRAAYSPALTDFVIMPAHELDVSSPGRRHQGGDRRGRERPRPRGQPRPQQPERVAQLQAESEGQASSS